MSIQDRVIRVISEETLSINPSLKPEEITPDTTMEELHVDSLDAVSLIMALEGEFEIEIPDREAASIITVGDPAGGGASW